MGENTQATNGSPNSNDSAATEIVLFESGVYADRVQEEDVFNRVMRDIETVFKPSVLIGTVGLWHGRHNGYRYIRNFKELQETVCSYDSVIIRQSESGLWFTLIHHDGYHEMELRCIIDDDNFDWEDLRFSYFDEGVWQYIIDNSEHFCPK